MTQLNFDATNVAPASAPEALETGWYPATVIMTEQKPTKANDGAYLEVTNRISSGPASGRTLKDRLNLWNKNEQAVTIAYSQLSAICHAAGRLRVGQAAELHGSNVEIYVKKVPRNDNPSVMTNEVAGYRAIGSHGAQPGFAGGAPAGAPAWAQPPGAVPPPPPAAVTGWAPQPAAPAPQPAAWTPPAAAAPQPATQPVAAAPAAAGSIPPWAR